ADRLVLLRQSALAGAARCRDSYTPPKDLDSKRLPFSKLRSLQKVDRPVPAPTRNLSTIPPTAAGASTPPSALQSPLSIHRVECMPAPILRLPRPAADLAPARSDKSAALPGLVPSAAALLRDSHGIPPPAESESPVRSIPSRPHRCPPGVPAAPA